MPELFNRIIPVSFTEDMGVCPQIVVRSYELGNDVFIRQNDSAVPDDSSDQIEHVIALTHTQALALHTILGDYVVATAKAKVDEWLTCIDAAIQGNQGTRLLPSTLSRREPYFPQGTLHKMGATPRRKLSRRESLCRRGTLSTLDGRLFVVDDTQRGTNGNPRYLRGQNGVIRLYTDDPNPVVAITCEEFTTVYLDEVAYSQLGQAYNNVNLRKARPRPTFGLRK